MRTRPDLTDMPIWLSVTDSTFCPLSLCKQALDTSEYNNTLSSFFLFSIHHSGIAAMFTADHDYTMQKRLYVLHIS